MQTAKTYTNYTYDNFNRLVEVDGIEYTYDGNGLMQTKDDTRFIWDGANIVAEITGNNIITYSRGLRLISRDDGTTKEYYHFNPHGDVVNLTDSSGNITESYTYTAHGEVTSTDIPRFGYCGEFYDLDTNLIYLRMRWYDSSVGAFINEDPLFKKFNTPMPNNLITMQMSNLYAYCANNPTRWKDPTGMVLAGDKEKYGEDSDTYKILVDLGNRWDSAGTKEEKDALHNTANEVRRLADEGTSVQYAHDRVMSTLHSNAATAQAWQKKGSRWGVELKWGALTSYAWLGRTSLKYWDYKKHNDWQVPSGEAWDDFNGSNMNESTNRNIAKWMYFDGMLISGEDMGNLNLGYVAASMELPEWFMTNNPNHGDSDWHLLEWFGYDSASDNDLKMIKYGYTIYKQGR